MLCVVYYLNILSPVLGDYCHAYCAYFRFIQYNPTSLERSHKHDLLTEVDLGVPIDLILPDTYPGHDHDGELIL